jgi:hypothetical protein
MPASKDLQTASVEKDLGALGAFALTLSTVGSIDPTSPHFDRLSYNREGEQSLQSMLRGRRGPLRALCIQFWIGNLKRRNPTVLAEPEPRSC